VLIYLGGLLLCIVPGVIFGLMFSQYFYLQIDRRLEPLESLRQSHKLMQGNKLTLFTIGLAAALVAILAVLLTCGLGIVVVGPCLTLLGPVVYLTLTGQRTVEQMAR
jgi:uncharacterized membrane protein